MGDIPVNIRTTRDFDINKGRMCCVEDLQELERKLSFDLLFRKNMVKTLIRFNVCDPLDAENSGKNFK